MKTACRFATLRAALDSHRYSVGRSIFGLLGLPESNRLIDYFDNLKDYLQYLLHSLSAGTMTKNHRSCYIQLDIHFSFCSLSWRGEADD